VHSASTVRYIRSLPKDTSGIPENNSPFQRYVFCFTPDDVVVAPAIMYPMQPQRWNPVTCHSSKKGFENHDAYLMESLKVDKSCALSSRVCAGGLSILSIFNWKYPWHSLLQHCLCSFRGISLSKMRNTTPRP
jgi:hypothetical protein